MGPDWLVLKLGGTSVARKDCWRNAAEYVRRALVEGRRTLIVHSAAAGVTNQLEALVEAPHDERLRLLDEIAARHCALAEALAPTAAESLHTRLESLRAIVADTPPASAMAPAHRARILAQGEHLLSAIARPVLESMGLPVVLVDARDLLTSRTRAGAHPARHYLSATCDDARDEALARRLSQLPPVVLTQGFLARDASGDTVLLGRGGSDTSAACLAAKLGDAEVEIWTDVSGLFTADPAEVDTARLLRSLDYDEALEIAATGAKVLHPRCIGPLRHAQIPLTIRYAPDPSLPCTQVGIPSQEGDGRLKAVCLRRNITVITIETADMWHEAGFLADAFACFKRHDVSVDMIATSETSVTLTLDPVSNPLAENRMNALQSDLSELGTVRRTAGCAAVSLVGRRIRANLHRIAPLLELFRERRVHLVSQSANDLNVTFVVDEDDASGLVSELHALLIGDASDDALFGPCWNRPRIPQTAPDKEPPWWQRRRESLLKLARDRAPLYVYDGTSVGDRAQRLQRLGSVDRLFYAVKANCFPDVLRAVHDRGIGFECVSEGELARVLRLLPELDPERLLFTPNFAPRTEYEFALERGVRITLDSLYPLQTWPESFSGRDILLRVDVGCGNGHHRHVRTAGAYSKFGISVADLGEALRLATANGIRIVGLHAHAGSDIVDAAHWKEIGLRLAAAASAFPDLKILNLGGGLGVARYPAGPQLDLAALDAHLDTVRRAAPGMEIWLEPGRFLVAEAGVLLARVTQVKNKGATRYLGVETGMNSLLRPALYDAYHPIFNLDRLGDKPTERYSVVGPICETGDILGAERRLPETEEGDVLLISNAGAYGHVMSSAYNLRRAAAEVALDSVQTV